LDPRERKELCDKNSTKSEEIAKWEETFCGDWGEKLRQGKGSK